MRIYEIAKKLKVSSKDVITFLKGLGVDCSSHMVVLSDDVVQKVTQHFSKPLGKVRSEVKPVDEVASTIIKDIKPETDAKAVHVPKKSDYVAEPLYLEDTESVVENVIEKGKISRVLTRKIGFDKKIFRSGRRRRRRQKSVTIAPEVKVVNEIEIEKNMPLFEVANMMGKPSGELIMILLRRGMACNRNHILSVDVIKSLADHFGIGFTALKKQTGVPERSKVVAESKDTVARWPVVVVMGHVDHGKTTLLDYIRKMNVAGSEKGGITQQLGAYEVDSTHGKIVFIDTPGHEAFYSMRERGSKITDLAILVIAVDDGIMPQTVEAINHSKAANVPIIVAINKIDKMSSPAALETVKRQLSKYDLMPEEWGGSVVVVPISAKTGQGVNDLLEMIVLQAQLMELRADPVAPARAFVLESKVERGLGPVATVICSQGTLKQGDFFTCGYSVGRVRVLINSHGKRINQAGPSIPVQVVGFDSFASAGDWLTVVSQEVYLKARQSTSEVTQTSDLTQQQGVSLGGEAKSQGQSVLNLIIKADTRGSIDAVLGCIQKLSKLSKDVKCSIHILLTGIGDISESDIELAEHSSAIIYAFHVKPEKNASVLAKEKRVDVRSFDIVYHLTEDLEKTLESKRRIESVWKQCGEAVVKKIFDIKGVGIIAGCYMRDGVLSKGNRVTCVRDGRTLGSGKVVSLQRDKKTVKEIHSGYECGFICEGFNEWQEGDTVLCYAEVKENQAKK